MADDADLQQRLNTAADSARTVRVAWSIFPLSCGMCLPFLPSGWSKIQDWLHLVLVCGILASLICVIYLTTELYEEECETHLWCYIKLLSVACILPSTLDIISRISAYVEQLQVKEDNLKNEVESLVNQINETVDRMNKVIGKMAAHAEHLAEGAFTDRLTHFETFIASFSKSHARANKNHVTVLGPNGENPETQLLSAFKVYVQQWVQTFAMGLHGRRELPRIQNLPQKINACQSVQEVCETVKTLIGNWVDIQAKFSRGLQQRVKLPSLADADPETGGESGSSAADAAAATPERRDKKIGVSWIKCQSHGYCLHIETDTTAQDQMPMKLYACKCLSLTVMSKEHRWYMLALLMDICLIVFEVLAGFKFSLALVSVNASCLCSLLLCFEQIDIIAKIEKQIQKFREYRQSVSRKEDAVKKEWEQCDHCLELWKYWTLPCLTLMAKVQDCVLQIDDDTEGVCADRGALLGRANDMLRLVNSQLGDVDDWTSGEPEWVDTIGQDILEAERKFKKLDAGQIAECMKDFPKLMSRATRAPTVE